MLFGQIRVYRYSLSRCQLCSLLEVLASRLPATVLRSNLWVTLPVLDGSLCLCLIVSSAHADRASPGAGFLSVLALLAFGLPARVVFLAGSAST